MVRFAHRPETRFSRSAGRFGWSAGQRSCVREMVNEGEGRAHFYLVFLTGLTWLATFKAARKCPNPHWNGQLVSPSGRTSRESLVALDPCPLSAIVGLFLNERPLLMSLPSDLFAGVPPCCPDAAGYMLLLRAVRKELLAAVWDSPMRGELIAADCDLALEQSEARRGLAERREVRASLASTCVDGIAGVRQ